MSLKTQQSIVCQRCKKIFFAKPSYAKRAKFCSKNCSSLSRSGPYKIKIKIACKSCNKIFERIPSLQITFCSKKCMGKAVSKQTTYNCLSCNKEFIASPVKNRKYCSRDCLNQSLKCGGAAHEKTKKTNLEKYGAEFISQIETIKQKKHNTMKLNQTYGKSKIEDHMFDLLKKSFKFVERQVRINGWNIDFLIDNKIYIQLDGVYWHGLNRNINEIQSIRNKRDEYILYVFQKDSLQNLWFKENNKPLIRFTDVELNKIEDHEQLYRIINQKYEHLQRT